MTVLFAAAELDLMQWVLFVAILITIVLGVVAVAMALLYWFLFDLKLLFGSKAGSKEESSGVLQQAGDDVIKEMV